MHKFKNNLFNLNHKAFTLAEVLITLGIIGVIAAYTIGAILNNIQEAELKTSYRKVLSLISQAALQLTDDNGGNLSGFITTGSGAQRSERAKDKFATKLDVVANCNSGASYGICWHKSADYLYYYNYTQYVYWGQWSEFASMVLKDGTMVYFNDAMITCTDTSYCAKLIVDLNGTKGPNAVGHDIHWIYVYANSTKPSPDIGISGSNIGAKWATGY